MPKRKDIESIFIIGAGPIVIGQACEFDYSGSQACKSLREEGYRVVLVNSNPATIMTDPSMADATYIEPITTQVIEKILKKEKPHALLPTLGGQTGLNTAVSLAKEGFLERYSVEMIGVSLASIEKAENREKFRTAMQSIGLAVPKSLLAYNLPSALEMSDEIGYPLVIRPSFTLGGMGGSIAYNRKEFEELAQIGLVQSPISQILLEESILGWKEYELEVMRDKKDNVVIVCSIENFDPMGIHTGDSITVAPQQTLSDKEYQQLRNAAIQIIREIGVDTGGANIQFAVHPKNGELRVIEMNPRVSRSSALASKATGFPIAKIAAKLAVGYTLDEIPNDITRETQAAFEPSLDYCVVKIPRWAFEKFPHSSTTLGIQMKSVGEVMAMGRNFKEAFQKAIRSLEIGKSGFVNELISKPYNSKFYNVPNQNDQPAETLNQKNEKDKKDEEIQQKKEELKSKLLTKLRFADHKRIFYLKDALDLGISVEVLSECTGIDPWFLWQLSEIADFEKFLQKPLLEEYSVLRQAKQMGFSDERIAYLSGSQPEEIRKFRQKWKISPVYKLVDTCAGEFRSFTPYYYSSYDEEDEFFPSTRPKVMILGSGPNRIAQGIEFDYLCVQASFSLREQGYETIMVNSNPETVSTDYDTSDRLYFEPLVLENVLEVYEREKPLGLIVQLGGQTSLNLAKPLAEMGVPILGTSVNSIDRAEDRKQFSHLLKDLGFLQTENDIALSQDELFEKVEAMGYPVLIRPSYVLGGQAMEIVHSRSQLLKYLELQNRLVFPILIDRFLQHCIEVDVDAVSDGKETWICGVMEHIEEAGIHSGDSACVLPPHSLDDSVVREIERQTKELALALGVQGLINIQFVVQESSIYVLEVNPRGSRTIPFVSKASGVEWARLATQVMLGKKLSELTIPQTIQKYVAVKEAVLPFDKFLEEDIVLGPEMRSTGEVMGLDTHFGRAFVKAQMAAGSPLPLSGTVFISVSDRSKPKILESSRTLNRLGFQILATQGTKNFLLDHGISAKLVHKLKEARPNLADLVLNGEISLIFNTPEDTESLEDSRYIRQTAIRNHVPLITTVQGFLAAVSGIEAWLEKDFHVFALQELSQ